MNTQQLTDMATTQGMYFQTILPSFLSVISGLFKALEESSTPETTLAGGFDGISWSTSRYIFSRNCVHKRMFPA